MNMSNEAYEALDNLIRIVNMRISCEPTIRTAQVKELDAAIENAKRFVQYPVVRRFICAFESPCGGTDGHQECDFREYWDALNEAKAALENWGKHK